MPKIVIVTLENGVVTLENGVVMLESADVTLENVYNFCTTVFDQLQNLRTYIARIHV